jgi:hypothetical protein
MKSPRQEALEELTIGLVKKFGNSEAITSIVKAEVEELTRNRRRIEVKDIEEIERKISVSIGEMNTLTGARGSIGVFDKIRMNSTISASPVKNAALLNISSVAKSMIKEPKKCFSPAPMGSSFLKDSIARPDMQDRSKSVVRSVEESPGKLPPIRTNLPTIRNGKKMLARRGDNSIFPAELNIDSSIISLSQVTPSKAELQTMSSSMTRELEYKPGIPTRIDKVTKNKYDQWGYIYKMDQIKYKHVIFTQLQDKLRLENQIRRNQYKDDLGVQLSLRDQTKQREAEEFLRDKETIRERLQEYNE